MTAMPAPTKVHARGAALALGLGLALLPACGARQGGLAASPEVDDPAARASLVAPALDGYSASYVLLWQGARVGEARERFATQDDAEGGYRFTRTERIVLRRGSATSTTQTTITIDTDAALTARHVVVERVSGGARLDAEAVRLADDGWQIRWGNSAPRIVDGGAVPSTLVPLLVAIGGSTPGREFEGDVLMEGSALALAHMAVDVAGDRSRAHASLRTASGEVQASADLDARGFVQAAGSPDGVASRRASDAELARPFDPPEIVDASSVAVEGTPPGGDRSLRLEISGVAAPPPVVAEVEAQTVRVDDRGRWEVTLMPSNLPPDTRELRERTAFVSKALVDDLGAVSLQPEEALEAGRGDCTAHALLLAKLLNDRGTSARLVTGFVLERGRLHRHRWVIARAGDRWIPLDPMYDQVPAAPTHLALAVHGGTPDELAFIDDVAFAGWERATVRVLR